MLHDNPFAVAHVREKEGPRMISVILENGPLHGERVDDVPFNAVAFFRGLDDGTVVGYQRWDDNVWRFDDGKVS